MVRAGGVMGERESSVEDDVVVWAENRGWLARKVTYIGRRGAPDRWFFKSACLVIMEFKRPGVDEANPQQQREHRRLVAAGFPVHVINDRDEAVRLLGGERYERD